MANIKSKSFENAEPELKETYTKIEKKFGKIPNIFLNLGHSLPVLNGFLSMGEAADKTSLSPKIRELIALTVAEKNKCNYCLSVHAFVAEKSLGMDDQKITEARRGISSEPKVDAILKFAKAMVEKNGHVSHQEVEQLKAAGIDDKEIVEIIYVVMLNMFTNYFNHVTDPAIDFPIAQELALKNK